MSGPVEVGRGERRGEVGDDGRVEQRSADHGLLGGVVVRGRSGHDDVLLS
ncbi:hypothetical protein [Micromonospora halophytica]|nr:hypothetical protein [Micromonospora halophytica]